MGVALTLLALLALCSLGGRRERPRGGQVLARNAKFPPPSDRHTPPSEIEQ